MDSILKKGVLLVSLTGIMTAFPMAVHAADIDDTQNIPAAGNTQILEDCYTSDKTIPVHDHLVFRYGIRKCTIVSLYKK